MIPIISLVSIAFSCLSLVSPSPPSTKKALSLIGIGKNTEKVGIVDDDRLHLKMTEAIRDTKCYPPFKALITWSQFDISSISRAEMSSTLNPLDFNPELLKEALDNGVNFDLPYSSNQYPIHYAISSGNIEIFEILVEKVDLSCRCLYGLTPLHHALLVGNAYMVKRLLEHKADPHLPAQVYFISKEGKAQTFNGYSFASLANSVTFFRDDVMDVLFEIEGISAEELYEYAVKHSQSDLLILYSLKKLLPNLPREGNEDAIIRKYIQCSTVPEAVEYFKSIYPIDEMVQTLVGEKGIHYAIESGDVKLFFALLYIVKVDPMEHEERFRYTPLHHACEKGNYVMARELIKVGVDIDFLDFAGATPAQCISHQLQNKQQMLNLMISSGCDCSIPDIQGYSLMDYAIQLGPQSNVKLILEKGNFDPRKSYPKDCSGFMKAVIYCYPDVIQMFLDHIDFDADEIAEAIRCIERNTGRAAAATVQVLKSYKPKCYHN